MQILVKKLLTNHFHLLTYLNIINAGIFTGAIHLVPVDILLAFEPLFVDATYSGFIGGLHYRGVDIPLNITLPCMPSNSSTERALALLLRWVSFFVVSFMHVCM